MFVQLEQIESPLRWKRERESQRTLSFSLPFDSPAADGSCGYNSKVLCSPAVIITRLNGRWLTSGGILDGTYMLFYSLLQKVWSKSIGNGISTSFSSITKGKSPLGCAEDVERCIRRKGSSFVSYWFVLLASDILAKSTAEWALMGHAFIYTHAHLMCNGRSDSTELVNQ